MKKFIYLFALLFLMSASTYNIAPITINDFALTLFHYLSPKNEIDALLGKPIPISSASDFQVIYPHNNLAIYRNNKLAFFVCRQKNLLTSRGLKIGDSKEKIIQKYGTPTINILDPKNKDHGQIQYSINNDNKTNQLLLDFQIYNNKIQSFSFGDWKGGNWLR